MIADHFGRGVFVGRPRSGAAELEGWNFCGFNAALDTTNVFAICSIYPGIRKVFKVCLVRRSRRSF